MTSYLLCATPRSGSTLLCGLLRSTGIAGRPESYFKREQLPVYADRWGVPRTGDAIDVRAYVAATVAAGRTPNGVFGARIMWGTMTELTELLASVDEHRRPPRELLTAAFGPVRFLHLRRADTVAQAVSWARAQQSHYWHPGEDTVPGGVEPHYDRAFIAELVETIDAHETAWRGWFAAQDVTPYEIGYEELADDPVGVAQGVLAALDLDVDEGAAITVRDRRQADELNADWISRFRG